MKQVAPESKVVFLSVLKKTNTRFWAPKVVEGEPTIPINPTPGTVVDKLVTRTVKPGVLGEFYLVSTEAGQGTASPTDYLVLENDSKEKISLQDLQLLSWKLCHMYYNFNGAISMPAPCQNAYKVSSLIPF